MSVCNIKQHNELFCTAKIKCKIEVANTKSLEHSSLKMAVSAYDKNKVER